MKHQLSPGPILRDVLPEDMILRIKAFKNALKEVDTVALEESLDAFKRDRNPEVELLIWERIASTYQTYLAHNPATDLKIRKDVYAVLVGATVGMQEWSRIKHLSPSEINHIILNYTGV